jgi:hypothetical protein
MADESAAAPLVPVSWGELLDKVTILEIKRVRLPMASARANAERELAGLTLALAVLEPLPEDLVRLKAALAEVNRRLWDIEDAIRAKEATGDFGAGFVTLARSVYRENDKRGRIKQAINHLLRSPLIEEKHYAAY